MTAEDPTPFPKWQRPSQDECRTVVDRLIGLHGKPARSLDPLAEHCGGSKTTLVLDSLIRTLLSQNTTDITSIRAFKTLKERFPTWQEVLAADDEAVEDAIRVGGLAAIKVQRMKALLQTLVEERGDCCLEWLREESTDDVKTFLQRFKGFGPKTISCVLLFCLHRDDFPVDTHVLHITQSLGWCPPKASREQAYEHLNARVPDDLKYDLHVLLVQHGKVCSSCSKSGRGLDVCPIAELKRLKGGSKGTAKPKKTTVASKRKGVYDDDAVDEKKDCIEKGIKVEDVDDVKGAAVKRKVRMKREGGR